MRGSDARLDGRRCVVTAIFGAFMDNATAVLADAGGIGDLPSSTVIATTVQMRRLATALSRYVTDPGTFPEPSAATLAGLRLFQAAASLGRAAEAGAGLPGPGAAHPLPGRIGDAASAILAGQDLLATHVSTSPDGSVWPRTPWARALASASVRAVLLNEVAILAELAGQACRALAEVPSPALPAASRDALRIAGAQLSAILPAVPPCNTPGAAHRQLLRSTPVGTRPARHPPAQAESPAGLCQAIEDSAERIRSLTFMPGSIRWWPPSPTLATWRWSARAAAIIGHIAGEILTGLAARSRPLLPGVSELTLTHAAIAMGTSWNAWRHAASTGAMLTDVVAWNSPAPLKDDLTDLMIRMGRLAYASPLWTPAAQDKAALKTPDELAPGPAELRAVLAAVHHAADALARVAARDLEAVRTSAAAGRISAAYRPEVIPAPASELRDIYQITHDAARCAAETLDGQAQAANAPSAFLALIRATPAQATGPGEDCFRMLAAAPADQPGKAVAPWRACFPAGPIAGSPTTTPAGRVSGSRTAIQRRHPRLA